MKKIIDWIIDRFLAGFIIATIFYFAKLYHDAPTDEKKNFFQFNWLTEIFEVEVKLWKAGLVILIIIFLIILSKRLKIKKSRPTEDVLPKLDEDIQKYRTDTFGVDKAVWTWDYSWNTVTKSYNIINVTPLCPVCRQKMELNTSHYSGNSAQCSKCRLEGRNSTFELRQYASDVGAEVVRRVNSGEWAEGIK